MKNPLLMSTLVVALLLGMATAFVYMTPAPVQLQAATWFGEQARPIPEFTLTDHSGQPFQPSTMQGKWHLLFFGYTHCPDICPDTMQMMATVLNLIEDPNIRNKLQVSFVSVDPERDSLDQMKKYVTYFHPEINSVRGDLDDINKVTDALGILHYIEKKADQSSYEVAHSSSLTLIDDRGRYTAIFSAPLNSTRIAADLTTLIQG